MYRYCCMSLWLSFFSMRYPLFCFVASCFPAVEKRGLMLEGCRLDLAKDSPEREDVDVFLACSEEYREWNLPSHTLNVRFP